MPVATKARVKEPRMAAKPRATASRIAVSSAVDSSAMVASGQPRWQPLPTRVVCASCIQSVRACTGSPCRENRFSSVSVM
jgi:hypothetical protein